MTMNNLRILFFVSMSAAHLMACSESDFVAEEALLSASWWEVVPPILIGGDAFYGELCSVTRVSSHDADVKSAMVIFTVPSQFLATCAQREPEKNYLDYDGEFIILNVDRQTFGAGSSTGERYRSADFTSWQQYIGVTWVNGEEYEAWRNVGPKSEKLTLERRLKIKRNKKYRL
jgi:hypothetical protein